MGKARKKTGNGPITIRDSTVQEVQVADVRILSRTAVCNIISRSAKAMSDSNFNTYAGETCMKLSDRYFVELGLAETSGSSYDVLLRVVDGSNTNILTTGPILNIGSVYTRGTSGESNLGHFFLHKLSDEKFLMLHPQLGGSSFTGVLCVSIFTVEGNEITLASTTVIDTGQYNTFYAYAAATDENTFAVFYAYTDFSDSLGTENPLNAKIYDCANAASPVVLNTYSGIATVYTSKTLYEITGAKIDEAKVFLTFEKSSSTSYFMVIDLAGGSLAVVKEGSIVWPYKYKVRVSFLDENHLLYTCYKDTSTYQYVGVVTLSADHTPAVGTATAMGLSTTVISYPAKIDEKKYFFVGWKNGSTDMPKCMVSLDDDYVITIDTASFPTISGNPVASGVDAEVGTPVAIGPYLWWGYATKSGSTSNIIACKYGIGLSKLASAGDFYGIAIQSRSRGELCKVSVPNY